MPQLWFHLIQAGAFSVIAAYLLHSYRRGARVGEEPHCAKCDYALEGSVSDACPECGAALDAGNNVVRGRIERQAWRKWVGLVLAFATFGSVAAAAWSYRTTAAGAKFRTTASLLHDMSLQTGFSPYETSYAELRKRYRDDPKSLDEAHVTHLRWRREQPPEAGDFSRTERDYFNMLFHERRLPSEAEVLLARRLCVVDFCVPPVVLDGKPVQMFVASHMRLSDTAGIRWRWFRLDPTDEAVKARWEKSGELENTGVCELPLGTHTLSFVVNQGLSRFLTSKEPESSAYVTFSDAVEKTVRVVARDEFDAVVREMLTDAFEFRAFAVGRPGSAEFLIVPRRPLALAGSLSLDVEIRDLRVPVGAVDLRAGFELPFTVVGKSLDIGDAARTRVWAEFTPSDVILDADERRFAPVAYEALSIPRKPSVSVARRLAAALESEPARAPMRP